MAQKNALSRRQFRESEFDDSSYEFNLQSGEFVATIDCKRWGKRKKFVYIHDLRRRSQNRSTNLAPKQL